MDSSLLNSLLSLLEESIYNKDKESIYKINDKLNEILKDLDKEKLISKFIQINGEYLFNKLKVENEKSYFETLPLILKSSYEYIKETGDYLYLISQLSIVTDWFLYNKINLVTD